MHVHFSLGPQPPKMGLGHKHLVDGKVACHISKLVLWLGRDTPVFLYWRDATFSLSLKGKGEHGDIGRLMLSTSMHVSSTSTQNIASVTFCSNECGLSLWLHTCT